MGFITVINIAIVGVLGVFVLLWALAEIVSLVSYFTRSRTHSLSDEESDMVIISAILREMGYQGQLSVRRLK